MAKRVYLFIFGLLILICQNSVYANPGDTDQGHQLAARLEAVSHKRLSSDDFRRLERSFSKGLRLQTEGLPQKTNISYNPENEIRYLVCVGGSASGGISFAGTGICSDMNGRIYGLEIGLMGVGVSLSGVVWAGYWFLDHTVSSIAQNNGQHLFKASSGGAAYILGGRALCGWGKGESELCMLGLELGVGASAAPTGYLILNEHKSY